MKFSIIRTHRASKFTSVVFKSFQKGFYLALEEDSTWKGFFGILHEEAPGNFTNTRVFKIMCGLT